MAPARKASALILKPLAVSNAVIGALGGLFKIWKSQIVLFPQYFLGVWDEVVGGEVKQAVASGAGAEPVYEHARDVVVGASLPRDAKRNRSRELN